MYKTKKFFAIALLVGILLILTVSVASAAGGTYHTVYSGETLFSIGRYYGVNPYHIADVNGLYDPNCIFAGQVLYIPTGDYYGYDDYCDGYYCDDYDYGYHDDYYPGPGYYDSSYGYGHYPANHHRVRRGETLTSIAYYYGVSPWAIASANHIYDLNRIYAGQFLYIPSDGGWSYSSY